MKRIVLATAAVALAGSLALPAQAEPVPRTVVWRCQLENGDVVDFVVAPERARHGIEQANSRAGEVFAAQFGEDCDVV
jgi:hypothetical protein